MHLYFYDFEEGNLTVTQKSNRRALRTIRLLRTRQHRQGQKIDILCRDMVSAHEQFALKLTRLGFVTSFYESLLGCAGLDETLQRSVELMRDTVPQAGAAIFLAEPSGFDIHLARSADQVEQTHFQRWFTRDIVDQISRTNRICTLEEMLKMGLQAPPSALKTLSAAAVPLGRLGRGGGFVLIYRAAGNPLQSEELSRIAAVAPGLREAIVGFKSASADLKT